MNYAQEDAIRQLVKEQRENKYLWDGCIDSRGDELQDQLLKLHKFIDGEDEQLWNNK